MFMAIPLGLHIDKTTFILRHKFGRDRTGNGDREGLVGRFWCKARSEQVRGVYTCMRVGVGCSGSFDGDTVAEVPAVVKRRVALIFLLGTKFDRLAGRPRRCNRYSYNWRLSRDSNVDNLEDAYRVERLLHIDCSGKWGWFAFFRQYLCDGVVALLIEPEHGAGEPVMTGSFGPVEDSN